MSGFTTSLKRHACLLLGVMLAAACSGSPNPPATADGGTADGGSTSASLTVAGTVTAGMVPAVGAQVQLVNANAATTAVAVQTDASGAFSFSHVAPGTYTLAVAAFDFDGDGTFDYQPVSKPLGMVTSATPGLDKLAIQLQATGQQLVGSSLTMLSATYPIDIATLVSSPVSGVLPIGAPLSLSFGFPVDPAQTTFTLGSSAGGRVSVTPTWDKNKTVTLATSLKSGESYDLQITALRFADGTTPIAPGSMAGHLTFTIPESTQLSFALTAPAASVTVDAARIWLLDANGDFIATDWDKSSWNAANPPVFQWKQLKGAAAYHVVARQTAVGSTPDPNGWKELLKVPAPATLTEPVVATVNPFATFGEAPWANGATVEFAVTAEDAAGQQAAVAPDSVLATTDTFGGLLSGAQLVDGTGTPVAHAVELGSTFQKTFRFDFSEPMRTDHPPTLVPTSQNIRVKQVNAVTWGDAAEIATTTPASATSAYVNAELSVNGGCTELLADAMAGDMQLQVRDTSLFSVEDSAVIPFFDASGTLLREGQGITAVANGQVTLEEPLGGMAGSVVAPRGSLACPVEGATSPIYVAAIAYGSVHINVTDVTGLYPGEPILIYSPFSQIPGFVDLRHIVLVDSIGEYILIDASPSQGHQNGNTVIFPWNFGAAEYALRPAVDLSMLVTADVSGGPGAEFLFDNPPPVAVGDMLLVDVDGDLRTTSDQVQTQVQGLTTDNVMPQVALVADLPFGVFVHQGTSVVIDLGDSFTVAGVHDTSPASTPRPLDVHADQFSPGGMGWLTY